MNAASSSWRGKLTLLRREIIVGLPFGLSLLPICLASGVLVFSPLGPDYLARGIGSGLYSIIFGATCAALFARSSFIISGPRTTLALIQATAVAHFVANPLFAGQPAAVIAALAACVLLAGIFRIGFTVLGVARIIKYTPHPVLVGFTNGAALAVMVSQIKPFINLAGSQEGAVPYIVRPWTLVFVVMLAAFIFSLDKLTKKIPASIVGLAAGTLIFYLIRHGAPDVDLGRAIGYLAVTIPPPNPLGDLWNPATQAALVSIAPDIFFVALALATVATFESLLVFRTAQNLADQPYGSRRDLVAQGVGTCLSATVGGLVFSPQSGQTRTAYRNGGRTRIIPITIGISLLAIITLAPAALAAIPIAAISAVLLQNSVQSFDESSLRLLRQTLTSPASPERRRAWYDLLVIGVVMGVTVVISVLPGVLAGVALACIIFIANMSRPIVRRRRTTEMLSSNRRRSAGDEEILQASGRRRLVLELHGVLFFGNADDLSDTVTAAFAEADVIALDLRGIVDIDASGATIVRNLAERSRKRRQHLVFCNVPLGQSETIKTITRGASAPAVFPDLDSALEWMEESALQAHKRPRSGAASLPLDQHDFLHGLDETERALLLDYLTRKHFPSGTTVCAEGDAADRMWLLTQGSVSIRLNVADARGSRRIGSFGPGTTVGEIAFIDSGVRSAHVITDEETVCYELERAAFDRIRQQHPGIVSKLLTNLSRNLARRLRSTSEELREIVN
jgi:SulP family sulfate permease